MGGVAPYHRAATWVRMSPLGHFCIFWIAQSDLDAECGDGLSSPSLPRKFRIFLVWK